jgi:hypothetical protein
MEPRGLGGTLFRALNASTYLCCQPEHYIFQDRDSTLARLLGSRARTRTKERTLERGRARIAATGLPTILQK